MGTSHARRRRLAIRLLPGVASLILPLTLPQPVASQSRSLATFHLHGGMLDAAGELPNAPVLDSEGTVVSYGRLDALAAFGASVTLDPPTLPVDLRVRVARSLTGSRTGEWGCASGPCPSILIEVPTDVTMWLAGFDIVPVLSLGAVSVRPLAGIAWLIHRYEWDPGPVGSFSLAPGRHTSDAVALSLGAAVSLTVGRADVSIEYTHHFSDTAATRPGRVGALMAGVGAPLG